MKVIKLSLNCSFYCHMGKHGGNSPMLSLSLFNNKSLWKEGKFLFFCMTPLLKEHCPKVKDMSLEYRKSGNNTKQIKHISSVFKEPDFRQVSWKHIEYTHMSICTGLPLEIWVWATMWSSHLQWGKCAKASSSPPGTYIGCRPVNKLGLWAWLSLYKTTFKEMLTKSAVTLLFLHTITRGEIKF